MNRKIKSRKIMTNSVSPTLQPRPKTRSPAWFGAKVASVAVLVLTLGCGGDSGSRSVPDDADMAPASGDADAVPDAATPAEPPAFDFDPAQLPEGVTEAMVLEGREIFQGAGICYTCHTMEATGGPLAPDLTDDEWLNVDGEYASIVELVKTGVAQPVEHPGAMLPRAGMPLTDEQVAAVAAYAYVLSR